MKCRCCPAGGGVGGDGGAVHPRHDGAGLHGAADAQTQGHHHEEGGPGEVQGDDDERAQVEEQVCATRDYCLTFFYIGSMLLLRRNMYKLQNSCIQTISNLGVRSKNGQSYFGTRSVSMLLELLLFRTFRGIDN